MKRKYFIQLVTLTIAIYLLGSCKTSPRNSDGYGAVAEKLRAVIDSSFYIKDKGYYSEHAEFREGDREVSYLWPLCALIQADREEQAYTGTAGLVDKTLTVVEKYYDPKPPRPGYASYPPALGGGDRFYDDNQWIGIALMDAWFEKKETKYLEVSKLIYDFMMTAYDTVGGGGLYWEEGKPTKNTCSNGPGIILALQLHKATGEKAYLDTALLLYNWVNANLRDENGLYLDNIEYPSGKVDDRRYSYNTGTMLQSGIYLFEITGDSSYLKNAQISAKSAQTYFYGGNGLRDDFWFNAVLLRGYQHLQQHDATPDYIEAFKKCVNYEIANYQQGDGLFTRKGKTVNLVGQGGMLEILYRLALIDKSK